MKLGHKEEPDRLTIQLAVKEGQLVKPLSTLRFELGQRRFGFLCLGVVLITDGLELLIVLRAVLEGSCGDVVLLIRLGSSLKSPIKILLQDFMNCGTPFNVVLEPLDLGCVLLFLLLRLGLSIGDLILQLQVLKNEQLEKLTTLVMRLLQKTTRARLKGSRGLAPEIRMTGEMYKCKMKLGDCPSQQ